MLQCFLWAIASLNYEFMRIHQYCFHCILFGPSKIKYLILLKIILPMKYRTRECPFERRIATGWNGGKDILTFYLFILSFKTQFHLRA